MEKSLLAKNIFYLFVWYCILSGLFLIPSCENKTITNKAIGEKITIWSISSDGKDSSIVNEKVIFDTIFMREPPSILQHTFQEKCSKSIFYKVKQVVWTSGPFRLESDTLLCASRRTDTITIFGKQTENLVSEVRIQKHFCNTDTFVIKNEPIISNKNKKQLSLNVLDTIFAPNRKDIAYVFKNIYLYDNVGRVIEKKQIDRENGDIQTWYRYEYKIITE